MIRVAVFPDRPECVLFFVPEDECIQLPEMRPPFTKSMISEALRAQGIPRVDVFETVPGRWTQAMSKAMNSERAARRSQQNQAEATQAAMLRGASHADVRERSVLLLHKQNVDGQIRDLKEWIGNAKARVVSHGEYEDPHRFRQKEASLEELKQESQAIQSRLGELRKIEKARNIADGESRLERFKRKARELLDEEMFLRIENEADAEE